MIVVVAGCGILGPNDYVCTQIGCLSGLSVRLEAMPEGGYKVELLFPGIVTGGVEYAYECDGGASCRQEVLFPELTLESVAVRVTTSTGTRITEFSNIAYTITRPNGADCPGTCRNATVVARLPT